MAVNERRDLSRTKRELVKSYNSPLLEEANTKHPLQLSIMSSFAYISREEHQERQEHQEHLETITVKAEPSPCGNLEIDDIVPPQQDNNSISIPLPGSNLREKPYPLWNANLWIYH